MGMFDYVKSSYPLGEDFSGQCQTKDIEIGFGGTMTQYWISPVGQLYVIDYSYTADFEKNPNRNRDYPLLTWRWVPNGNHGKVSPMSLTKSVTIYPDNWRGKCGELPKITVYFNKGIIESNRLSL